MVGGVGVNIDNAEEDNTAERDENVMKQKSSNNTIHRRSFDEDPYDFSTKDPAKSRALESSLWEMTALENHYFPQVTKLVQMLRMDLGDRVKTKEIDISGGGARSATLVVFRELLFPLERRVGRSLEIGGVETRHYRGSRFISLG